jgi:hypothetical protein
MPAPFVPLSVYPDFRMAMLNWLQVTSGQFTIYVPSLHAYEGSPPREQRITMAVAISGGDTSPIVGFKCGGLEHNLRGQAGGIIYREASEGGLSAMNQVAVTCVGHALNLFIAAAFKWEQEQKAEGYDVDAVEALGESLVDVVNRLAAMFRINQQYSGKFTPPCWSPRWDEYRVQKRMLTPLERLTGALYEYSSDAIGNLRAGRPVSYGFSVVFRQLYDSILSESRLDREEEEAVKFDEGRQIEAFWQGVKSYNRRLAEAREKRAEATRELYEEQGLPYAPAAQRQKYPTREERELKVLIPDFIEIEDFSKSWRDRRDK